MADAGAFVDDLDAVLLEFGDVFLRLVAGGLDDLDAGLDDGLAVFRIGRRLDRGQNGEVHAERLVGHVAAACDFLGEVFRRRLRQRGDQAERAGIGDGGDELGAADPLHAALDDRVLDANELGESRLDHDWSSIPSQAHRVGPMRLVDLWGRRMPSHRGMSIGQPAVRHAGGGAVPNSYWWNSLCSSPMPSIAMVTVLTGSFITPTPTRGADGRSDRPAAGSCRGRFIAVTMRVLGPSSGCICSITPVIEWAFRQMMT